MLSPSRFRILAVGLGLWALIVWVRLAQVQVVHQERWQAEAMRQQERVIPLDERRGDIRTRDGRLLAGSLERVAVYANPRQIPRARWGEVAQRLSPLTGLTEAEIAKSLSERTGFFYLGKDFSPDISRSVARLNIRGVGTLPVERRVYPHGSLAGPVVGFVNIDGVGQAGLEASYQKTLAGSSGLYRLIQDGKRLPTALALLQEKPGRPGLSLVLTIESRIQMVVEEELARTVHEVGAEGAAGVVMDPITGEVLAMVSLPAYDPGAVGRAPREWWRNRAVEDALEPGSSFKPVVFAAALTSGVLRPSDVIDCSGGGIQVAGAFIRDHAHYGMLPVRETLAKSSNVGAVRVAHRTDPSVLENTIRALGFGQATGVELPAEARGILRPVGQWSALSRAGLAIGQEVSASPIQMARAYAVLANGGRLVRPTLVRETRLPDGSPATPFRPEPGDPVLSPQVAAILRDFLETAVSDGTGRGAQLEGYRLAGKTGTAQKATGGGYGEGRHAAWFAGFFPAHNPRVVLVVCIDEPKSTYWASAVAAPVVGRIAARLVTLLGLPPPGALA